MVSISSLLSTILSTSSMGLILTIEIVTTKCLQKKALIATSIFGIAFMLVFDELHQDLSLIMLVILQIVFLLITLLTLLSSLPTSSFLIFFKKSFFNAVQGQYIVTIWDVIFCVLLQWLFVFSVTLLMQYLRNKNQFFSIQRAPYTQIFFSTSAVLVTIYLFFYCLLTFVLEHRHIQSVWILPMLCQVVFDFVLNLVLY